MSRKVFRVLIPDISCEDISALTERRQKMLISLMFGEKTLTTMINDIKKRDGTEIELTTILKGLKLLVQRGFVKKSLNKVYELTKNGKLLALFLARFNGIGEDIIIEKTDNMLKEKNSELTKEQRNEVIEILTEDVSDLFCLEGE